MFWKSSLAGALIFFFLGFNDEADDDFDDDDDDDVMTVLSVLACLQSVRQAQEGAKVVSLVRRDSR